LAPIRWPDQGPSCTIGTLVPLTVIFKIISKRLPLFTIKVKVINSENRYLLRDNLELNLNLKLKPKIA